VSVISQINRVVQTYCPEVIDQKIEDTEDDNEHGASELRLEANYNHDTSDEPEYGCNNPPDTPRATEDESNKEED